MRPSEASVSTQTGLTLSSGPSVLARMSPSLMSLYLSLEFPISSLSVFALDTLFLSCFLKWVFSQLTAGESEGVMVARSGTTTVACKYGCCYC